MKKIILFFITILILILPSCTKNDKIEIVHNYDIINEVFTISSLGNDYSIHLPIATTKKIETLELEALFGDNVELLQCKLEYDNDSNERINKNYVNGFSLSFKCESNFPEINITGLNLRINGRLLEYSFGTINLTKEEFLTQGMEHLIFLNSPITGYDYISRYLWEVEVQKDIKITKVYTSSNIVSINDLRLNNSDVTSQDINQSFKKGHSIQFHTIFNLEDYKFDKSIVGFDLIIEYVDEESGDVFFTKSPAIFRIYACDDDFSLLYE